MTGLSAVLGKVEKLVRSHRPKKHRGKGSREMTAAIGSPETKGREIVPVESTIFPPAPWAFVSREAAAGSPFPVPARDSKRKGSYFIPAGSLPTGRPDDRWTSPTGIHGASPLFNL